MVNKNKAQANRKTKSHMGSPIMIIKLPLSGINLSNRLRRVE